MAKLTAEIMEKQENGDFDVEVGIDQITGAQFLIIMASIIEDASEVMNLSEESLLEGIVGALEIHKGRQNG